MTLKEWNQNPDLAQNFAMLQRDATFTLARSVLDAQAPHRSAPLNFGQPPGDYLLAYGMELGYWRALNLLDTMARPATGQAAFQPEATFADSNNETL